jgi:Sulfotransferase family
MCTVNHDLKAIYIHIPKTGGYYVEETLIKYYGFKRDYSIKPNHYGFMLDMDDPLLPIENRGAFRYCTNNSTMFPSHIWNSYYKFTFVRNPYPRIISAYEFLKGNYNGNIKFPSFKELLIIQNNGFNTPLYQDRNLLPYHYYHLFITQTDHLIDNSGNISIDFIGRNESLNEDLINVLQTIGVSNPFKHIEQVKRNVFLNKTEKLELEYYIDEDILHFVNDYFKLDFNYFNYPMHFTVPDLIQNININNKTEIENKNAKIIESFNKSLPQLTYKGDPL